MMMMLLLIIIIIIIIIILEASFGVTGSETRSQMWEVPDVKPEG